MKSAYLTQINIYPIKSTQPCSLSHSLVQPAGLVFDRSFMLAKHDGTFITARKHPQLLQFTAMPIADGLYIEYTNGSSLIVKYKSFSQQASCEVWGTHFPSYVASDDINKWFSDIIGESVFLRWTGFTSQRHIKGIDNHKLSFADGYPLLLTNQQTLKQVQEQCPISLEMQRFRPNLVVDNIEALNELSWHKIKIGEIEFINAKPCIRCVLTTRDPFSGDLDNKAEPYRTLKKYFSDKNGQPIFGINLIPLNSGIIRRGDLLEIIEYK